MQTFTDAINRFPAYALFWLNRGIAEENLKLIDEAIASQERCLALMPDQADACGNLSNLYRAKFRFADAEKMARRSLALGASKADALNSLGLSLYKQGKFDEARSIFAQAHDVNPASAAILSNQANLEVEVFNFSAAWKLFAAAQSLSDEPVFRHDEALARLLAGDFELGHRLYEARLAMPNALRLRPSCARWRGENLKGKKLLIIAEQGFGDIMHFCRYQKFIREGELVWAVPEKLVRLLAPSLRGTVLDEKGSLPVCDYYVPILSLALQHPLPFHEETPYLCADKAPALPPGERHVKIGLVWAGSKTHQRDYERSLPLKLLMPVVTSLKADFYAPFLGEALKEIGEMPIRRLDDLITDFADTAALLRQMDCLITVDTAVAHLAGALGVKTFLLVSHCPDWRWGTSGEMTPLYPSLTILRQREYGDWKSVIEALLLKLQPLCA